MPNKYVPKGNRFQWSMEDMERAAISVRNGDMPSRQAAKVYGVPRSTLQRHLSGNCSTGQKGPLKPVFTPDQENSLSNHIIKVQQMMYGLTPECIRKMAYHFAELNNIRNRFSKEHCMAGKDWLAGFMKRHPNLSMRTPESTSLARLTGFNRTQVGRFFQHLADAYDKYQFSAERIFNMDESGLSTVQTKTQKIIAQKGSKQVGIVASAEKGETTTILCAFNAAGSYIPPAFIFKRKQLNAQLMKQAPAGSVGFTSDSGWINEDIFVRWLDHFAVKANCGEEKTLLILDNHASHCSLAAITRARELNIEMISIPPHCSHKLQPLDRTFFGSLKNEFRKESFNYLRSNPGKRISQYEIAELFTPAYTRAASLDKGVNGFRTCGIFPLNPDIFTDQDFAPSEVTERDDAPAPPTTSAAPAPPTTSTAPAPPTTSTAPPTDRTVPAPPTASTASAPPTTSTAPPTDGTVPAPPTDGTVPAPPTTSTAPAPPTASTAPAPPTTSTAPPTDGTVPAPPNASTAPAPPTTSTAPPTDGTVPAPPNASTASAPPTTSTAPPTDGTVPAPPTDGTAPPTTSTAPAPPTTSTAPAPPTTGISSWETVSPLPKCNRNTGSQRKRKCGQSEHLTGSPFKNQKCNEEKTKSKKPEKKCVKGNGKMTERKSVKGKGKMTERKSVKGKGKKTESVCVVQEFFCIYCNEQYVDPPAEDWIECYMCKKWCHEHCALVTENSHFICDLCS